MNLATTHEMNHWPLKSHELALPAAWRAQAITAALKILENVAPRYADFVNLYCREVYWVELKPDHLQKDDRITSASFPALPDAIFISNKALHHIPPASLFPEPSLHALAENIYHEAVHQKINGLALQGLVMSDAFDSCTAPKIPIVWRQEAALRNQFWELDRAYHAAHVYAEIIPLREALLEREMEEAEREIFTASLPVARECLTYLINQLTNPAFRPYFTLQAQAVIAARFGELNV